MRLRWKLTLSYTLVTAGAILLVEIILLGAAVFLLTRADTLSRFLIPVLSEALTDVAPALETQPPDTEGLQTWLDEMVRTGKIGSKGGALSQVDLNLDPASLAWALFLDTEPRVVAASPEDSPCQAGQQPADCLPSSALAVAQKALGGERRSDQLAVSTDQGLYAAVPVQNTHGQTVGALVFSVVWPTTLQQWPRAVVGTLLPSAGVITLFAALIGTLFGYLTARSLTRRLTTLSQAADAWSQGDFSVSVRDTSRDELGQLAQRLNQMAEQLENLMQTRQELATLEERNRLARDLHDSVKQQVFAAGMQIAAARQRLPQQPQQAREALTQAENLVRQAQGELTALIRELRPVALEGKGLVAALREYLQGWQQQTGIAVDFQVQNQRGLPLAVEQALFRMVQEALANVARHSRAQHVTVFLGWEAGQVRLEVRDDGQGFDPQKVTRGLGLTSIAERARALGGECAVESQPGHGTRLDVRIPLTRKAEGGQS